jgi:hypothetical protein
MKSLMDEVRFEKGGAVVHMCKKSNNSSTARNDAQMTRTFFHQSSAA